MGRITAFSTTTTYMYTDADDFQDDLSLILRQDPLNFVGADRLDDQHASIVLIHEHGVVPALNG